MIAWALPRHSLKTRILLVTVVLFVAGIWTLSLFASRVLRDDIATAPDRRADFQAVAPSVEAGLYLVPKVIE